MKGYWCIPLGICFAGCMTSNGLQYETVSETNLYHIAMVRKGMSEKQVLQIMHKPFSYESFQVQDDMYDVWFYVTRVTGLDQTRMVPQNLTPLTFKNGILVGYGYYWYYYAMKEQAAEVAAQKPPVEKAKTQEEEDTEFEKALRPSAPPSEIQNAPQNQEKLPSNVHIISNHEAAGPQMLLAVQQKTLAKARLGMTEEQVTDLLGSPMDRESLSVGSDMYEIWFYDVPPKNKSPSQRIPLTFKNGRLVGMTQDDYNKLNEDNDRKRARMEEDESDQDFNYW